MILVRRGAAGSSRGSVRTTKSPASISSVKDSPGVTSTRRILIGRRRRARPGPVPWETMTEPSWDEAYAASTPAPWDIGRPPPAFVRLAGQGPFFGVVRVLGRGAGGE